MHISVDYAKNNGDASKMTIAPGCKGSPCNLEQFCAFISKDGQAPTLANPPNNWDSKDMKPEHVDWAAKALRDAGATGAYEPNKIVKGAGRSDLDGVFRKVGQYIQGAALGNGITDNMRGCALNAVSTWADLRKWAQQEAFMQYLEKKYGDKLEAKFGKDNKGLVGVDKRVGQSQDTVKTFEPRESYNKLIQCDGLSNYKPKDLTAEMVEYQNADPGHNLKVTIAAEAKAMVQTSCGSS